MLDAHLSRIKDIDREMASLRAELERRGTLAATEPPASLPPPPRANPPVTPLRIPRTIPKVTGSQASTTRLLRRVSQLEKQDRSVWREFLGRLAIRPRRDT